MKVGYNKKLSYNYVKSQFELRGYELLEKSYVNAQVKMKYRCLKHPDVIQEIKYNGIQQGKGCRLCAGNYPLKTIEEVNYWFVKNGIKITCLEYGGNARKKSKFKCQLDGYVWETALHSVKKRGQCPKCSGVPRTNSIEQVNSRLELDKIDIICTYYAGTMGDATSKFKCLIDGYEWNTCASNILSGGKGCAVCANVRRIKDIEEVNGFLNKNNTGLVCIDYIGNVIEKSKFQCKVCQHVCSSSKNVSKRSPKRLAPWST